MATCLSRFWLQNLVVTSGPYFIPTPRSDLPLARRKSDPIHPPKQARVACISPRVRWDRSKAGQRKAVPAIGNAKSKTSTVLLIFYRTSKSPSRCWTWDVARCSPLSQCPLAETKHFARNGWGFGLFGMTGVGTLHTHCNVRFPGKATC